MAVEEVKDVEKKNVLVGIQFDSRSRELLDWALVKVAEQGDRVVAVHVCRNSDPISKYKPLLHDYLDDYDGLCNEKQVDLTGQVWTGSSIRKVLVREAKNRAAMAVIVGITKRKALGGRTSIAKYCAKRLPPTIEVLAIHNGKVVFRRDSNSQLLGFGGDPKPSFHIIRHHILKDNQSEFGDSEISEMGRLSHEVTQRFEGGHRDGRGDSKDEDFGPFGRHKKGSSSGSLFMEDLAQQSSGWPLCRAVSSLTPPSLEARKMSVVQWVMSFPNRSLLETPQFNDGFSPHKMENALSGELPENLELLLKTHSSGCKWFSHDVLKTSTAQFSSENMIGKGGWNRVYKGLLPDGKPVAVKILESSKETWKDFILEVEIMTILNHKNITPLLGICVEDNDLISVYDFKTKGNLEENLRGNSKDKSVLSWEVRFNVAVAIAEALNYLHNECSQPIIHRDVKSSNILLSDEYQAQLSDFGLAIWGSTTSPFLTHSDVVGTFGYLAPEYFMYGKVSDKIDVYSFGVVLLELLSGKEPIGFENPKGQESLVMWAKPRLESGDLTSILDPDLDKNVDKAQMQRMALAAALCLTRAARLRPKMSQILKILKGEQDVEEEVNTTFGDDSENQDYNDDEVYPDSCAESHLGLALLDVDNNSTSFSSVNQSSSHSLEEYLKRRWSRSSSLE